MFLLAAVAVAEAPFVAMWVGSRAAGTPGPGTVYVETEPSGAEVRVNGKAVGRTPARLAITRGAAVIELRREGSVRVLPLTIVPEEVVRLRVDLPATPEESIEMPGAVANISADVASAAATDATVESNPPAIAPGSASAGLAEPRVQ